MGRLCAEQVQTSGPWWPAGAPPAARRPSPRTALLLDRRKCRSRFFSLSRPTFRFFSLWGLLARNPCGLWSCRGSHKMTPEKPKRATWVSMALNREKKGRHLGDKKARHFGPSPGRGPHTCGRPPRWHLCGPRPFGPPLLEASAPASPHTATHQFFVSRRPGPPFKGALKERKRVVGEGMRGAHEGVALKGHDSRIQRVLLERLPFKPSMKGYP